MRPPKPTCVLSVCRWPVCGKRTAPSMTDRSRNAMSNGLNAIGVDTTDTPFTVNCAARGSPGTAGARCDVHVDGEPLRFIIGDDLVKTAARTSRGDVKNKRAFRTREQA